MIYIISEKFEKNISNKKDKHLSKNLKEKKLNSCLLNLWY